MLGPNAKSSAQQTAVHAPRIHCMRSAGIPTVLGECKCGAAVLWSVMLLPACRTGPTPPTALPPAGPAGHFSSSVMRHLTREELEGVPESTTNTIRLVDPDQFKPVCYKEF